MILGIVFLHFLVRFILILISQLSGLGLLGTKTRGYIECQATCFSRCWCICTCHGRVGKEGVKLFSLQIIFSAVMWNMTILTIRIAHYTPCLSFYFELNHCLLNDSPTIFRLAEALCTYIEHDRPFLGICLGLQLLFESSEENGPGSYLRSFYYFKHMYYA